MQQTNKPLPLLPPRFILHSKFQFSLLIPIPSFWYQFREFTFLLPEDLVDVSKVSKEDVMTNTSKNAFNTLKNPLNYSFGFVCSIRIISPEILNNSRIPIIPLLQKISWAHPKISAQILETKILSSRSKSSRISSHWPACI